MICFNSGIRTTLHTVTTHPNTRQRGWYPHCVGGWISDKAHSEYLYIYIYIYLFAYRCIFLLHISIIFMIMCISKELCRFFNIIINLSICIPKITSHIKHRCSVTVVKRCGKKIRFAKGADFQNAIRKQGH